MSYQKHVKYSTNPVEQMIFEYHANHVLPPIYGAICGKKEKDLSSVEISSCNTLRKIFFNHVNNPKNPFPITENICDAIQTLGRINNYPLNEICHEIKQTQEKLNHL